MLELIRGNLGRWFPDIDKRIINQCKAQWRSGAVARVSDFQSTEMSPSLGRGKFEFRADASIIRQHRIRSVHVASLHSAVSMSTDQ